MIKHWRVFDLATHTSLAQTPTNENNIAPNVAADDSLTLLRISEVQREWDKLTAEQQRLLTRILIVDGLNWDQIDDSYWKKLPPQTDETVTDYLLERSTLLEHKSKGNASLASYVGAKKFGIRDQNLGKRTWKVKSEFREALEIIIRRS